MLLALPQPQQARPHLCPRLAAGVVRIIVGELEAVLGGHPLQAIDELLQRVDILRGASLQQFGDALAQLRLEAEVQLVDAVVARLDRVAAAGLGTQRGHLRRHAREDRIEHAHTQAVHIFGVWLGCPLTVVFQPARAVEVDDFQVRAIPIDMLQLVVQIDDLVVVRHFQQVAKLQRQRQAFFAGQSPAAVGAVGFHQIEQAVLAGQLFQSQIGTPAGRCELLHGIDEGAHIDLEAVDVAGAGGFFAVGDIAAIAELDDMRAVPQARQNVGFAAKSAVFPQDVAIVGDMLGPHDLESDLLAAALVDGIQHARIMPQRKGVDVIFQLIQIRQSRHGQSGSLRGCKPSL